MNTKKKNVVCLIALLNIACGTAIAQEQQTDVETLQRIIADASSRGRLLEFIKPKDERKRILESGVPPERVTEMLEDIVRKGKSAMEKFREEKWEAYFRGWLPESYRIAEYSASYSLILLREFPGPNTLALLRECAPFEDQLISPTAIETYIALAGGDSVPFLRELIEKNQHVIKIITPHLGGVISDLKKKGRNDDVEKFHALMLEQLRVQSWTAAERLDAVLCATLDGYIQSVQRVQLAQKHINSENNFAREGFAKIKAEVDAVPADKRVDLSKRFKFLEQPKEKGEN